MSCAGAMPTGHLQLQLSVAMVLLLLQHLFLLHQRPLRLLLRLQLL